MSKPVIPERYRELVDNACIGEAFALAQEEVKGRPLLLVRIIGELGAAEAKIAENAALYKNSISERVTLQREVEEQASTIEQLTNVLTFLRKTLPEEYWDSNELAQIDAALSKQEPNNRCTELRAEIERLTPYTRHSPECRRYKPIGCTCGLDAPLSDRV